MSDFQPDTNLDPPKAPRWGPARIIRLCTGVHEPTLSKIASERPRYTAMGGVVAGTALIAMISMSIALYCVFGELKPVSLAIVPVWGLFILSLDRWLISSTMMDQSGAAVRRLLPRLLISIALGIVVAEPLLLGVYNTAITERVSRDRADELTTRESDLLNCNPIPGTPEAAAAPATSASCQELKIVVIGDSPQALRQQQDDTTAQITALQDTVDKDSAEFERLERTARDECNGTKTPDTTGRYGVGPSCRRLRALADKYYADHKIAENSQRLVELRAQEREQGGKVGDARNKWVAERDKLIHEDLSEVSGRQQEIGLLERFRALDALVSENGYVNGTQWALRIFLIIIDALPVLLKTLSGFTPYDQRLREQLWLRERLEQLREQTELRNHSLYADDLRHKADQFFRSSREVTDHDRRVRNANLEQARGTLIEARARDLLRTAGAQALLSADPEATHELYVAGIWPEDEEGRGNHGPRPLS